ncbi:DUF1715-domain-containing protein [Brachionus plicatilis]|uniref:DUF1715-domain-containing protein n=1 Tax=Brachionus plicatilis TaxID=10195 RepID=A0A3M7P414_BRAPC|nr:DUF1715-domain-containing protein [Brachionus plicatilis]
MDDPFEAISNLTSDCYNSGFKEGILNGKKIALTQGFKIGIQTSFKIPKDIGNIYATCSLHKNQSTDQSNDKVSKLAIQICDLIDLFEYSNCHAESFESNINLIKDKFKQFCSLTSTKSLNLKNNQNHLTF